MSGRKTFNLYLGCANPPFREQDNQIMFNYKGVWKFLDKFVKGENIENYGVTDYPYKDVGVIYNSHLLEHIPLNEVQDTINHWYKTLSDGGRLIINTPDIEWACKVFIDVLKAERNGEPISGYYNSTVKFLDIFYGNQAHDGEFHYTGFTKEILFGYLMTAGFKDITIKQKFDEHDMGCLVAEAIK